MKIGILTFHRAHNYGAVLQAYALQEYLKKLDVDVEIIDYRQPYIESVYKCFSFKRCLSKNPLSMVRKIFNEILFYKKRKKKKGKFKTFCDTFLTLSEKSFYNREDMPQNYDIYIHGSDQIWNDKLLGGYDMIYFGGYKGKKGALKVSYAASFENKEFHDSDNAAFKKGLSFLDYISVREEKLIDRIRPLTNNKIMSVVDPTLLASSSIWGKMISYNIHSGHYILTYVVGNKNRELVEQNASFLGHKLDFPVISINALSPSPDQFVSYIRNADFVISDSFHATVFSVIFEKNFYTIASGTSSDVRFIGLLSALSLEDRIIKDNLSSFSSIDYETSHVKAKLDAYRCDSINYIKQITNSYENY